MVTRIRHNSLYCKQGIALEQAYSACADAMQSHAINNWVVFPSTGDPL